MSANGGSYGKVWDRFWPEAKRAGWSSDMVVLGLYLLTCRHHVAEGIYYIPKGYISADLGWDEVRTDEAIQALGDDGFARYDQDAEVVFLPSALRYNRPDNEKHVKGITNKLRALPETYLLQEFLEMADEVDERVSNGYRNPSDFSSSISNSKRTSVENISTTDTDWGERAEECLSRTAFSSDYQALADALAAANKTGKVRVSRVVRALYEPLLEVEAVVSPEAMRYGLECAIGKGAANANYVKKAAAGYSGQPSVSTTSQRQKYRHPDGSVRYCDDDTLATCAT